MTDQPLPPQAGSVATPNPALDLVSWLSSQLDEDEAGVAEWHTRRCSVDNYRGFADGCDCGGPDRALRQVAAHRRILARHRPISVADWDRSVDSPQVVARVECAVCLAAERAEGGRPVLELAAWPCPDVCSLAEVYSDRPGFDPSWAAD